MTISLRASSPERKLLLPMAVAGYRKLNDVPCTRYWYQSLSEPVDCFTHPVACELDARGLRCPLPLLKAKQTLRDMSVGQVLRVLATDAGSVRDFQAYAQLSGQDLLAFAELDAVYCYLLKKSVG